MTNYPRALLAQALREDLVSMIAHAFRTVAPGERYLPNWHLEAIAHLLARCAAGEIKRLIITLPPRSGKSIAVSVAFPAWLLGHDPSREIICVSYSAELANKHSRDCRALLQSPAYKLAFPGTVIDPRKNTESLFETTRRGARRATSVGGTLTGLGGSVIIVDDSMKPDEAMSETARQGVIDWYYGTLLSRLNNKEEGTIIVVQQRLHEGDLVGHLLEHERDHWHVLNLPAIAEADQEVALGVRRRYLRRAGAVLHPERESRATLDQLRASMGSETFAAQYQQAPMPAEGAIIRKAWLRYYQPTELPASFDRIVMSLDTANKAEERHDFSVCTVWGQKRKDLYLLHVWRQQVEFPDLIRAVKHLKQQYRPAAILIEDQASGQQLIQQLNYEGVMGVKAVKPLGDKVQRLHTSSISFENGSVRLPHEAPWLDEYLRELTGFPGTKHADQVDSTTQALRWFLEMGQEPGILGYYREMHGQALRRGLQV